MVTKKNKTKDLNYYINLPWTYIIEHGLDEKEKSIFIIRVKELPKVSTDAPTIEEAYRLIKEAMVIAFKMYLEDGDEIPEPINEEQFRGNIAYRTTTKRHFLIAKEAKKQNLSLSQIIDNYVDTAASLLNKNK